MTTTSFLWWESKVPKTELNLSDYYRAMEGEGPYAFDWCDKPHRLVYDLIKEIEQQRLIIHSLCIKAGVGPRGKKRA